MSDHSADSLDHASEVEQVFRERAIEAATRQEKAPKDFDGKTCYDCGEDMVEQRLALGKFRCVGCQTAQEKLNKHFRR